MGGGMVAFPLPNATYNTAELGVGEIGTVGLLSLILPHNCPQPVVSKITVGLQGEQPPGRLYFPFHRIQVAGESNTVAAECLVALEQLFP